MGNIPKSNISLWTLSPTGELSQLRGTTRLFWRAVQIKNPAQAQQSLQHSDKFDPHECSPYVQIILFSLTYFPQYICMTLCKLYLFLTCTFLISIIVQYSNDSDHYEFKYWIYILAVADCCHIYFSFQLIILKDEH